MRTQLHAGQEDGRQGTRRGGGRRVAAWLVMAAAVTLSACATLGRAVFREPVVDFRNVQINGLGVTGGSLDLILGVYNPNNFDLEATRFTYRLMMADSVPVADGALDERFVVQEGDTSVVRIPVSFTYAGLGRAASELLRSGTVNYRVLGDVTVATPLGNFTRPYDQRGTFTPMRGAQRQ